MEAKTHWETIYTTKSIDGVSWYQPHATRSLGLISATGLPPSAALIDVGGGASTLVDDLLVAGWHNLTVLDLSAAALRVAQARLGAQADRVIWREANILAADLPAEHYDLWHDRAVFHFLTEAAERSAYVAAVAQAVKLGGYVIVATFAEDGPLQCSGLPVQRYRAGELHAEFGARFTLLRHEREAHQTPFGTVQQFVYCVCRREGD